MFKVGDQISEGRNEWRAHRSPRRSLARRGIEQGKQEERNGKGIEQSANGKQLILRGKLALERKIAVAN